MSRLPVLVAAMACAAPANAQSFHTTWFGRPLPGPGFTTAFYAPVAPTFGSRFGYPYGAHAGSFAGGYNLPHAVRFSRAFRADWIVPYVPVYGGVTVVSATLWPADNFLFGESDGPANRPEAPSGHDLAHGTAGITLMVPADAEVTFQGQTSSTGGSTRAFVTPPLSGPGSYDMKVRFTAGGQTTERTVAVPVRPGERTSVQILR